MLDRNLILDKDLAKLADQTEKVFKKKMDIARGAVDNLPDSEAKIKAKMNGILKSSTNKNANHEDLMKELNKIVTNGR